MKESSLIKNVDLFLDDKPSVYALRDRAKKCLFDYGFPTKKNENWKYTDVKEILIRDFDINPKQCDGECCCENKVEDSYFIEFCFCAGALHVEDFVLPDGVNVIPLPLMLYEGEYKKYLFNAFDLEKHPFACLNGMYLEQGICIIVDKGIKVDVPLLIKYKNTKSDNIQMNIHNVVVLEKNANLSIVEEFYSKEDILSKSTSNRDLLDMLDLEKTLVYFLTSLKANDLVLDKLSKGVVLPLFEGDDDLLDDAIIENKQAIEQSEIYRNILGSITETYGTIVSNNLNEIMKFLAGATIVISVPTMISSFLGMNVPLGKLANNPFSALGIFLISSSVSFK